ncbi:phosphatase, partial [Streptomyces sp. NPDC047981]
MPQNDLSACPGCAEPPASGDRYCGACGYDLAAVPATAPGQDRPTVAIGTPVDWPEPPSRDPNSLTTATQHPGDLPGTDSGGRDLPTMAVRTDLPQPSAPTPATPAASAPMPAAPPATAPMPAAPSAAAPSAVSAPDAGAREGDFTLAAPDPRAAAPAGGRGLAEGPLG